uniref:Novel STAND NTPase 3 domain-containing protein n=1 Tax=Magallana gigas TaxID=29159 RepID=A0A8W8IGH6_MAGGI
MNIKDIYLFQKKLDGYRFPVYSTELCPRNQTEWNERSSAINCTEDNGYLCFPNEKFTQLLEFCHRARFIWIQEGYCLYLRKDDSTIYSYSCSSFQSGCHNSSFPSYDLFEHSGCTSIGNGCFLAEPSCKGSDTTTSLPETTKPTHVENVTRNYSTTVSTDEKTNQTLTNKDYVIYDEIFMMPILAGVLIPIIIFCMLCIIYRTGYHICETKSDVESPGEGERKQLLPDPNKMLLGTNKEGYHICETESDVESPGEGERKQLLPDPNKMPLGTNKEESNIDRAIFRQWKEENENFVITRACKQVEKIIKKQNMVVVTGNSGSGKSAIIQHIALNYRSDGWTVKPIYSVKEIIDAWSKLQDALDRTLLVFNDPLGNESFDEEKYKSWKYHEESKCKENYCALVLLVLCNNQLCVEDMQNDNRLREKFELALKLCEMKSNTAPHSIDAALKTLEGFFVKKIDDTYHFYHDFVMEVTTCVFGTDYPLETIQYADIGFLRRRVNLKCSNDNREEMKLENCDHKIDEFTIFLKDTFVEDLVDRLFNEIFGERMLDVVLNPCMRNEKVATCFIKKLKDNPDKLNELLAKKQIHKEFVDQEDNQAFKQSFGSKLDFLFLEDKGILSI